MNFSTKDLRAEARQKLQNNWGSSIAICLVANFIPMSLGILAYFFDFLSFFKGEDSSILQASEDTTASAVELATSFNATALVIAIVCATTSLILSSSMALGKSRCFLEIQNGKKATVSTLFSSFKNFKKSISLFFLIFFKILLWSIVGCLPGSLIACWYSWNFFASGAHELMSDLFMDVGYWLIIGFCAILPDIIVCTMAEYRYYLSFYLLGENINISASEAVNQSKKMMYGHKWQAFKLELSFIGWMLLVGLTFGLAILWLSPYMEASKAAFFKRVQKVNA